MTYTVTAHPVDVANKDNSNMPDWVKEVNVYVTTFCLNMMAFLAGGTFSWAAPSIPSLDGTKGEASNPLPAPIDLSQKSWLVAFLFVGAMFGNGMAMALVRKLGRKRCLMIMLVPAMIAYLLFALTTSLAAFYVARVLNGCTLGSILQVVPVYVGEISSKERRGALGCFFSIFLAVGQVYDYSVGPLVAFTTFQYINLAFPVTTFVLIGVFVEESPFHMVDKGELEAAERALARLRPARNSKQLAEELDEIAQCIAMKRAPLDYRQLLAKGVLRRALLIAAGLMVSIQVSIVNPVLSYMETIFANSEAGISPHMSSVYVALLQLITLHIIPFVVDRCGRKILLVLGQTLITASLVVLGVFFHLKNTGVDVQALSWLPLLCILVFIVAFAIGVGSVSFVVIGEVLPENAKNVISTISLFINNVVAFTVLFLFPLLEDRIGAAPTYWIASVMASLTIVFIIWVLPETKGKSFLEIQKLLAK